MAEIQTKAERLATDKQKALLLRLGWGGQIATVTLTDATAVIKELSERIVAEAKAKAAQIDLVEEAGRRSTLRKVGRLEYAGPCPFCGGDDRLRVRSEWFFCRHCHEKRGDAIEYLVWSEKKDFLTVCIELANGTAVSEPAIPRKPAPTRQTAPAWNGGRAEMRLKEYQDLLWDDAGQPGQQYLEQRGLEPHTWLLFGLGYTPDANGAGPAIAMPWFAGGRLVAIRYRLLHPSGSQKITSEAGSRFGGRLFGGQRMAGAGESKRWLLITEGELNAMSAWQVAHDTHLDVLSLGSESANLSEKAIEYAQQFRRVVIWADRGDIAAKLADKIPGAYAVRSPLRKDAAGEVMVGEDGKPLKIDANDLLRSGLLGGFLALARADAATTTEEIEALLWALFEGALTLRGADTGTAKAIESLAAKLGKRVDLEQPEPGRWVAR